MQIFLEKKIYLRSLGVFLSQTECDGSENYKINTTELSKYKFVMSMLYISPLSNFMVIKAKRYNIPTVLISDGIIEWENMFNNPPVKSLDLNIFHPILHDIFLCVGQDETEYFNFLGYNTMQYLPDRMAPTVPRIGKKNTNTFLITTANTAYYNDEEKQNLVNLIQKTIKILEHMNIIFIFRIFDNELINILGITPEKNIKKGSFEDCLKFVDYVISTPSSISFTTMYHGKALAHLIYRDTPMFIQSGWNISGSISLKNTIESMIDFEQNRINFQDFQVSKYLIDNEKMEEEVLEKISKQKSENIEKFINQNLYNMLNSSFNFNIEYFIRKIYLKIKGLKLIKKLRGKIT